MEENKALEPQSLLAERIFKEFISCDPYVNETMVLIAKLMAALVHSQGAPQELDVAYYPIETKQGEKKSAFMSFDYQPDGKITIHATKIEQFGNPSHEEIEWLKNKLKETQGLTLSQEK